MMKRLMKIMINKIILNNFQSHKHSILEFSPGVNAVIGNSDSGKTSIIRAIYWVAFNRPSGNSFCSKWGGKTIVSLSVNEKKIRRVKSKDSNKYIMEENEWKAGTSVPELVSQTLNLKEINFSRQMDSPFMIFDTSGERSKLINKVTKMDLIDTVQSNISAMERECSNEIKRENTNLKETEESLKKYVDLDDASCDIENLKEMNDKYNNLKNTIDVAKKIMKEIGKLRDKVALLKRFDIKKGIKEVGIIIDMQNKIAEEKKKVDTTSGLLYDLCEEWKRKAKVEKIISDLMCKIKELLKEIKGKPCPLCGQFVKEAI